MRVPALPGGRPWLVADTVLNSALKLGPSSSHRTVLFEPGVVVHAMSGAFHQGVLVEAVTAPTPGSAAGSAASARSFAPPGRPPLARRRSAAFRAACRDAAE